MNKLLILALFALVCLSGVRAEDTDEFTLCTEKKCAGDAACNAGVTAKIICLTIKCQNDDQAAFNACMMSSLECTDVSNEAGNSAYNLCLNEAINNALANSSVISASILMLVSLIFMI